MRYNRPRIESALLALFCQAISSRVVLSHFISLIFILSYKEDVYLSCLVFLLVSNLDVVAASREDDLVEGIWAGGFLFQILTQWPRAEKMILWKGSGREGLNRGPGVNAPAAV